MLKTPAKLTEFTNANSIAVLTACLNGVTSFTELQARIAGLPTEQMRGSVFEQFAAAYLRVKGAAEYSNVWPLADCPVSVLKQLGLRLGQDIGVDGVLQTVTGDLHTYQVKFRCRRTSLTWTDLSTFFGASERAAGRLVFTNCDQISGIAEQRTGFHSIRGIHLDELTPEDLQQVRCQLSNQPLARTAHSPAPHQEAALQGILKTFETHSRATCLMACGTGKTLIGLWTAERLKAGTVLVLVPSLALIRQTMLEWERVTSWQRWHRLVVCSDPTTVEQDAWRLAPEELEFPVTTDPQTVRRFLEAETAGVKVVFCTYHSAPVVGEAMQGQTVFDLTVFDEAHRTAGRQGLKFDFALADTNLPSKRRLFMTATPKHYDVTRRSSSGEAALVHSMDEPAVYGPVCHDLPVARAIEERIICPYRVIVSVITGDQVNRELIRRGETVVNGDLFKAHWVANQLALADAFQRHGIRKAFTFHRTVANARAFSESDQLDLARFHVNGRMSISLRQSLFRDFAQADRAIMTNARCLTEGVNVPAVDLVAFLTPRRSRIDIVQAIGRALRHSEGKQCGYILVPVFVNGAEDIEAAVHQTDFDPVWEVLQALQEQDATLAESIASMRESLGRGLSLDDSRFADRVEVLAPSVHLDVLRRAITTRCVETLGTSWDERYGQLKNYKEKHGHCDVPHRWPEDPVLGGWVAAQRRFHRQHQLCPDRIRKLEELGFVWDPAELQVQRRLEQLQAFAAKHGCCNVPQKSPDGLGSWVNTQRNLKRRGRLDQTRIDTLEAIGLRWNPGEEDWEQLFNALQAFHRDHGHCRVPAKDTNRSLAKWIATLRSQAKRGQLAPKRIDKLNQLGFAWNARDARWDAEFEQLQTYVKANGHAEIPQADSVNPKLATWVVKQRQMNRKGKLSPERIGLLESIGFTWLPHVRTWNERLAELSELKRRRQPYNPPGDARLAKWLKHQKHLLRSSQLPPERTKRIQGLLVWPNDRRRANHQNSAGDR